MWLVAVVVGVVGAHVSLLFPPARFPPLDFLDSIRTKGPCGVPRHPRKDYHTVMSTGREYNVTWRLSYPHQGGFRLTLLDAEGHPVHQLVPPSGKVFAGTDQQTSRSALLRFPRPCHNCTLQLQRQAMEWGNSYIFHSCADVDVVESEEEAACGGRGRDKEGVCDCDPGYAGANCEMRVHCVSDSECGEGGVCVEEGGSTVGRSCFCPYGLFGKNCENQFSGKPDKGCFAYDMINTEEYNHYGMFNAECYSREKLNANDSIYFRHIESEDEVEVILDFATSSWVALGWRPHPLDPSCRLFPDLEGTRHKRQSADVESLTQSPLHTTPIPLNTTKNQRASPLAVMPINNGFVESALRAPLHAMDCIDMVVGAVREGRSRVADSYSRDRSTPLDDSWYDGQDSLSGGYGVEVDGRTVVMFRRARQEIEPTDHPLGGSRQFVVWAKGQTQGHYSHAAPSALNGDSRYYENDSVNYHGVSNRGQLRVDLAAAVDVEGNRVRLRDEAAAVVEEAMAEEPPLHSHQSIHFSSHSATSIVATPLFSLVLALLI